MSRTSPARMMRVGHLAPGLLELLLAAREHRHGAALGGQGPAVARPIPEDAPQTIAAVPSSPRSRPVRYRPMRYGPADSSKTPRFTGVRTFMRLPYVETLDDVDVAMIGVPIDDAVSYKSGARFGPEGIRSASALLRPYNQRLRVDVTEHLSMIDHGDSPTVPGYHEGTLRPDPGAPGAGAPRRGGAALPGRRPLDGARRAAGGRRGARPAGAGAPRRPRRRLGVLLRRSLLPRHRVQARRRGGRGRPARFGAGGHARDALRRVGHRGARASSGTTRSTGTSSSR